MRDNHLIKVVTQGIKLESCDNNKQILITTRRMRREIDELKMKNTLLFLLFKVIITS